MKYVIATISSFLAFWVVFLAVKAGYFFPLDHFLVSIPHSTWLVWLSFLATDVGGVVAVILGSLFLVLFLVIENKYRDAFYVAFSLAAGVLAQTVVKNMVAIARPRDGLVGTVGYSFPSGHTNMATILFLCAYLYVFSASKVSHRRRIMAFVCFSVIVLVGLSRVYLAAHWASDVLAGWCFGVFWATLPFAMEYHPHKHKKI